MSMNGQHVYCGDYIFSGHTMTIVLGCLVILQYSPDWGPWRLLHYASLLLSSLGIIFLLLGRGHYTVDVVIAYFVTTRLWWLYHTLAHHQQLKEDSSINSSRHIFWWRVFRFFERNVPCPLPNKYNIPGFKYIKNKLFKKKKSSD